MSFDPSIVTVKLSSIVSKSNCHFSSRSLVVTGPGGVLGISSDGDDRRIFLGLKFSIPGFFWALKFAFGSLI